MLAEILSNSADILFIFLSDFVSASTVQFLHNVVWLFIQQNFQVSPSTRYELSDATVLQCVLPVDGEANEPDSALYQNIAVHTDLLPNVYEG